jgi:AraC-like DNA-binding protein
MWEMTLQRAHAQYAGNRGQTGIDMLLGKNDRFFSPYPISGILISAIEKNSFPPRLKQQLHIDITQQGWLSDTISYQEMRYLFEHLWLGKNNDRTTTLFEHAARINYRSFGAISLAAMTLGHCEDVIRFCAKNVDTPWNAVAELNSTGNISLLHIPRFHDPELQATLEHFHFVNCIAISRSHTPAIPIAESVRFTGSCGISHTALERYFGCPVYFNEEIAQIDFSRQWLKHPTPRLSSALRQVAEQQAQQILANGSQDRQTLFQFFKAHLAIIHSADDMAQLLGISRRTLARHLNQQGASYSILSREVRLTQACRMLRHGETTAMIAEYLGFSDERSFRRAFKSWCGKSPCEYRADQERFLMPQITHYSSGSGAFQPPRGIHFPVRQDD